MAERKGISKKARFEVFKRDDFTCQYCGSTPPAVVLEVDHILAVANGGDNDQDNLVTSCFNCNRGKSAIPLDVIPESLAEKADRIRESEEQVKQYYKVLKAKKKRLEAEKWEIAEILDPGCSESGFNRANLLSIVTFLKRLDFYEVQEAAQIAYSRKHSKNQAFRYFCGVCWNKVRDSGG